MYREKVTQYLCTETKPVVSTKQGRLRGFQVNGTYEFLGIKYCDAKRFRMPEQVKSWDGIRDAIEYGYNCMDITTDEPWGWFMLPRRRYFNSEDCQYLNIWTQHIDEKAKKPVMVWIHGGGYFGGSAIDLEAYDGEALSRDGDVVVVTLNHRLNILGFLNLEKYGPEYINSANSSLADLVAALKWIQENISVFGGDPDNVTLFGQSGGAGKISCLMQTPAADGLYHKVILQSGIEGKFKNAIRGGGSAEYSERFADAILEELKITKDRIHDVDTLPYRDLADAAARVCEKNPAFHPTQSWAPTAGKYYLGNPLVYGFRKETKDIPMIFGSNIIELDSESPTGNKALLNFEKKKNLVQRGLEERGLHADTNAVMGAFRSAYPDLDETYAGYVDTGMRIPILEYLTERAKITQAPVYNYLFAFESDFKGGYLMAHGGELPFMLDNADHHIGMFKGEESERLQRQMSRSWLAFAATGDPNCSEIPEWKPFTGDRMECMIFGKNTACREGHDRKLLELLKREDQV